MKNLFTVLFGNVDETVKITDTTVTIDKNAKADEDGDTAEIPSPLTEHADIASLETAVGFKLRCPALPGGYRADSFIDISGTLAEVFYVSDKDTVVFRMEKGDSADISGDCNVYADKKTVEVGGVSVSVEGNGDVRKATWSKDGFAFSLTSEKGLTEAQLAAALK